MKARPLLSRIIYLAVGALAMCISSRACAEWFPPSAWWSDNHRFALVPVPFGFPGTLTLKERQAKGLVTRWSIPYADQGGKLAFAGALTAYITDDGRYVVLRAWDDETGDDKALTFLGPKGKILSSYLAKNILTIHEMLKAEVTPSLSWWRESGWCFFRPGQLQFAFVAKTATVHVFDLPTGRVVRLTATIQRAVRHEAVLLARKQLASPDYDERTAGAMMVGVLGDRDSIPTLKRLLNDPTVTGTRSTGRSPGYPFYDVQAAAGAALARLLGKKAAPLLEGKLRGANPEMARHWIGLLGEIGQKNPGHSRLNH